MRFQKELEKVSRRHSIGNVFDDFLQMAVCAFAMQRMEPEYLEACRRYDKQELEEICGALGALILDYEDESDDGGAWDDILGKYFEEVNSKSQASHSGQFFTPTHICDLMAKLTYGNEEPENTITVSDPCCGSSRNLIAHSRLTAKMRFKAFYVGQDLDYRCVKMSVLNLVFYGLSGVIIHMNTISMEIFKGYRVWLPETGLGVQPLSADECRRFLLTKKKEEVAEVIDQPVRTVNKEIPAEGIQQTLF